MQSPTWAIPVFAVFVAVALTASSQAQEPATDAPPDAPSFAMDFVHGPEGQPFAGRELGVHVPTPADSARWLDAQVVAPVPNEPVTAAGPVLPFGARSGAQRPAAAASAVAPVLPFGGPGRVVTQAAPVSPGRPAERVADRPVAAGSALAAPVARGGPSVSSVVDIPMSGRGVMSMQDLIGHVQSGGTPGVPAGVPANGPGSAPSAGPPGRRPPMGGPGAGCADRGLETILSPDCLRRLSPVPLGIGGTVSSFPLPAMPSEQYPGPEPYPYPLATPQLRPVVPEYGIGCTVTGASGSTTFRAADDEACIRGAIGMIPPVGSVSIMLLDNTGNTARAVCTVPVPGGRATCVGA